MKAKVAPHNSEPPDVQKILERNAVLEEESIQLRKTLALDPPTSQAPEEGGGKISRRGTSLPLRTDLEVLHVVLREVMKPRALVMRIV